MPQGRGSKKRTTRKPKEQPAVDAVIVALGDEGFQIQVSGSVKVREVPTLLRQAAKAAEKELGIE